MPASTRISTIRVMFRYRTNFPEIVFVLLISKKEIMMLKKIKGTTNAYLENKLPGNRFFRISWNQPKKN
jgi:hypothetical protein